MKYAVKNKNKINIERNFTTRINLDHYLAWQPNNNSELTVNERLLLEDNGVEEVLSYYEVLKEIITEISSQ